MTDIRFHKTRINPTLPVLALLILALLVLPRAAARKPPASVPAPSEADRLILYTSMQEEVFAPLVREFENRTGLWVSVQTGDSLSELRRIASGEKAGWDVILTTAAALESCHELFSDAARPSESEVSSSFSQTVFPYSFSNLVIIYNTKLVRLYPPDGWFSLLDPVWSGRIAFSDPERTGEGFAYYQAVSQTLSGHEAFSPDALSQALMGPHFFDTDELIRAVANGTYYIGVVPEDAALRATASGYDITIVRPLEETAPVANGMAVLKDSPHQENAGKFLDFLLDETIQEYLRARFFFCPLPNAANRQGTRQEAQGNAANRQGAWQNAQGMEARP